MALGPSTQSALVQWANTYPLDYKVESGADLSDGTALSKILAEIDSTYLRNVPAQANTLQRVVKGIFRYVQNECEGLDPLLETPGLREVVEKGKSGSVFEILAVLLMAAFLGPHRETHIMSTTKLDEHVQREIINLITQKEQEIADAVAAPPNGGGDTSGQLTEDFELEFEVRYGDLISQKKSVEQENNRLKKQNADSNTRIERLQDNNDHLQERLAVAEDKLERVEKDKDAADVIKGLEDRLREQDELISNQEGQLEQDRMEKARMQNEMERLKSTSDLVINLQDQNKELQFQNAELTKKSNTLDRYKQKLESQRDFQTDIKNLELENEELQARLKDTELINHRNDTLETTQRQYQNTLARHEMEIFELSSQKKALEEEKSDMQRAIIRLEEVLAADEGHIAEIQEQLVDRQPTISSATGPALGSLEAELEQSETGTRTNLEVSRLRAENQLLKRNATAAQEAAVLRIQLEEEERIRKREEQKYMDLYEKHVVTSQQVAAIFDASTSEGLVKGVNAAMLVGQLEMLTPEYYSSEAFANLRRLYLSATEKASAAERRSHEIDSALERTKRALLSATNDLSMIAQEDLDALQDLKATQESLASSAEMELQKLRSRHKDLQTDYDQQKAFLMETLISKDKLQQAVTGVQTKHGSNANESIETNQIRNNLDKTSSDLKASQEQLQKQNSIIRELNSRIQDLESGGPDAQKTALEQDLANLKRENAAIVTAWYGLNSRIQMDSVGLQRRQDAPKSWMNKQRQAVGAFGKRR